MGDGLSAGVVFAVRPGAVHDRLAHGARLVLFAVLCIATLAIHLNGEPTPRPIDDLYRELRSGEVSRVVVDRFWPASGQLTWSNGPLSWSRVTGVPKGEVYDPVTSRLDPRRLEPLRASYVRRLEEAARAGGGRVEIKTGSGGFAGPWAYAELERLWPPLAPLGVAAGVMALWLMLAAPRRRFATRWGWFWIFLGGGVVAYALLEPYPLWRRPDDPLPEREPLTGVQGLLIGLVLSYLPIAALV
ncbi:hypothetical protein [Thermostaphylospora chromogena]|uniref:Uncharacterized protein n=1 Tax=Thermostaphylospora chromogena TaxID=35622 RepID=A0A1H1CDC8_9ACTN|nr:hypothetical protein [Thermostaphylospora chromogena]SDQ62237.1 hypothetical protein SAMN04489764_1423 [Thermostaphylospora chromogena]